MKLLTAGIALALFFSLTCCRGQAQTEPRFEVSGQVFSFNNDDLGNGFGVGGRFGYYVKSFIALDSEFDSFLDDEGNSYAHQGQFGVKVGKRTKHFGIFAKARPGFMTNFAVNGDFSRGRTKFTFDAGGVLEGYVTKHLLLRLDVGDTIIPFGNDTVDTRRGFQRVGTTHSLQVSYGLGIRF